MFGPDWSEGCKSCSFMADNFDGIPAHLAHRDASFVAVSRAPLAKIQAYAQRMGWSFKWVSSAGNDFNFDYHVSFAQRELDEKRPAYNYGKLTRAEGTEMPGISAFYARRGGDGLPHLLDLRARHRHAERRLQLARPRAQGPRRGRSYPMEWVKRRDEYARR